MSHAPMIDLRNIRFERKGRTILDDISLTIRQAELVALVGLNGAGKTTMLSLLATLAVPSSGRIFIDGVDAVAHPARARSRLGVVFQESALEPRLSAHDNLLFIARLQGLRGGEARRRADELLTLLGLETLAAVLVQRLSGGQRRRLELARALVSRPNVLLLDEATLGLDVAARHAFWSEIRTLVADGRTVLCSTHHAEEAREADRVVVLHRGALVADGSWQAVSAPVSGAIRLRVPDIEEARRWLAAQGYAVGADHRGVVVSSHDPQSALPDLLQRLPCRALGADIAPHSLMDIIEHWGAAGAERFAGKDEAAIL